MANVVRVEQALDLISKGNQLEAEKDHWQAAHCFGNAMSILFQLAVEITPQTDEEERIAELYQDQCRVYLHRARKALIEALSNEDSADAAEVEGDPKFITLNNEEAKQRVQLFSTLFSKELELGLEDLNLPQVEVLTEQQSSLEARLNSLNSSLIPRLKTEEERMDDINRGLRGLGMNVYSHADQPKVSLDIPVSTEDQIADIIAQAKDEARLDAVDGKQAVVGADDDDVILTDDEESISADDEEEIDLGQQPFLPQLLNKKAIQKYVVNAQVKLAQLLTLLNAESIVPTKNAHDDDSQDDNDADAKEDELADKISLDLSQAHSLLLKANKNLSKAVSAWEVE
jgi:hypothetical protein